MEVWELINKFIPFATFILFVGGLTCYIKYKEILTSSREKDKIIAEQIRGLENVISVVKDMSDNQMRTLTKLGDVIGDDINELRKQTEANTLTIENMKDSIWAMQKIFLEKS